MEIYKGKAVYKGVALGKIKVMKNGGKAVQKIRIDNTESELQRMEEARQRAVSQLKKLYSKAVREVGEASAAIFEIHQMMLEDDDYLNSVRAIIETEHTNAEYAVSTTRDSFSAMFSSMDDEYMQARAADVKDISERLLNELTGYKAENSCVDDEPHIIFAEDLTPSETVQMDKKKILAFVTIHGSANSHTSILARMMNIPALVGVELKLEDVEDNTLAVVDGYHDEVILHPTENQIRHAKETISKEKENTQLLQTLKGKRNTTADGKEIKLFANIGSIGDMAYAMDNDAGGIGLFRSEFLYLGRNDYPTEEEQFQIYKQAAQMMAGKKIIIRTLDIGADKRVDYFNLGHEENPAMGYRAIRICLTETEVFKTQLRAIMRAAFYGDISVMYPMITSTEEVNRISEIVKQVCRELESEKTPYRLPEQGVMIETPAAALISDELAEMVDYFSIGTNDLTQYTLAIDRQNSKISEYYNPYHKAIMKLIKLSADNAHRHGKWIGICGELAADLSLTEEFLKMGIDELSVAPSMILKLRKRIREINLSQ